MPFDMRRRVLPTPAALFRDAAGAPAGLWLDPSDFSAMYQDEEGTTPVTGAGDPVGLILDKSQGGLNALGAEEVTNGGFDTDTDWTKGTGWTIGSGVASCDGSQASPTNLYQTDVVTEGVWYQVTLDVTTTSGAWSLYIGNGHQTSSQTGSGSFSFVVRAVGDTRFIVNGSSTFIGSIDNISVRELPGNHAIQSVNNDYRPTLQQDGNGKWYLDFDGVDDYLQVSSLDLSGTDKVSIFAGIHKDSDAAQAMLLEYSADATTNNGAFNFRAPRTTSLGPYGVTMRGTLQTSPYTTNAQFNAPVSTLVTVLGDISGDSAIMRLDGEEWANATGDLGTGNFGNHTLYIGSRAGSSQFFNGRSYGLTVVGKQVTAAELSLSELHSARKAGISI